MKTTALLLAAALSCACSAPAPPSEQVTSQTAPAAAGPAGYAGSQTCSECHETEVARHAESGHRLAANAATKPNVEAFDEGEVRFTLGGLRREDYLTETERGLQVIPGSWSRTRAEWVEPLVNERGVDPEPGSPWHWTGERRTHANNCSRCHPISGEVSGRDVAMSPPGSEILEPGIQCEHCHGPAAAHVAAAKRGERATGSGFVRAAPDAWSGCAHCHAVGRELPLRSGGALRPADAFDSHLITSTSMTPLGPDLAFALDGRPATPHGYEVQAVAMSACARGGELTCLSCHDPHGGLKDDDPDASCRGCHPSEAGDPAGHAKHPVISRPVPLARDEPDGPRGERLPGCVDCHAAATLRFGRKDTVRDHAITRPEPELVRDFRIRDACSACHRDEPVAGLIAWLNENHPDRVASRRERTRLFAEATLASRRGASPEGVLRLVSELDAMLSDTSQDDWTRASVIQLLGGLGQGAEGASPRLLDAAELGDVVLARAALSTLARTGTTETNRLAALARRAKDWRVRIVAAATLDGLDDSRGADEIAVLLADDTLPVQARAQASFELGMSHLRRGAVNRAAFMLSDATRLAPRRVQFWMNLGAAKASADDVDGARLAWMTVLDLEPGHPLATVNLARLEKQ